MAFEGWLIQQGNLYFGFQHETREKTKYTKMSLGIKNLKSFLFEKLFICFVNFVFCVKKESFIAL